MYECKIIGVRSLIRLDKFLSNSRVYSRREAVDLIKQGRVSVDGKRISSNDYKLDEKTAVICVDGKKLGYDKYHYYMMNKPAGVVSATGDRGQKTVIDLLSDGEQHLGLFPVGRLDKDTTGLLILTNDGDFAHSIISPKKLIPKKYRAVVDGRIDDADIEAFKNGIILADGMKCLPAVLEYDKADAFVCFITLYEGKYHQVKRMMASQGKHVRELSRLSIGNLKLDENLEPGEYKKLTSIEINTIVLQQY